MNSLMMLAALAIAQVGPEGTVYVPRTEIRESTTVVPRVVYDEVTVQRPVTVYDRYHYELVPDGVSVGPFVETPVVRSRVFGVRPFGSSIVEKFRYKRRVR